MPEYTIAIIPNLGYHPARQYSIKTWHWVAWVGRESSVRHAKNGGEIQLGNYTVDWYDENTQSVYEFHGCYWHYWPVCYPDRATDTHPHHLDRTYGTVYEQTFLQEQNLKDKEYTVVSIWEHEFDSQVKNQEELQLYTRIRLSRSIESQGHLVRRPHQCHSFVLYRGIYALCKCLFSVSLCSKVQAVSCGAPFNPHR